MRPISNSEPADSSPVPGVTASSPAGGSAAALTVDAAIGSADWTRSHQAPVVALFLHGFGANAEDLAALAPRVTGLPWASLQAPTQIAPGGYAWFPIVTPGDPTLAIVRAASDAIWRWVDANVEPTARVVPIGFSQGGLMATELLRTRPERVAATVVLSGFVQGSPHAGDETLAASRPPAFWGRGTQDGVITPDAVRRTSVWLPEHTTLTERVYPGMAHMISAAEADDVRTFLRQHS